MSMEPATGPDARAGARGARRALGLGMLAVAALGCWVCFYKLGANPMANWDEAIHSQVSHQILASGDWLTLHYGEGRYFDKPPLSYWLRALAFRAGGVNEFTARFWSALATWLTAILCVGFFGRLYDWRVGALSGLVLISSAAFALFHTGRSGTGDSLLALLVVVSFIALWRSRGDWRWYYVAGAATGLAWLTKGAVGLLPWLAAGVAVALERPRPVVKWRHALGGVGVMLLVSLPWQLAMVALHGKQFVKMFYLKHGLRSAAMAVAGKRGGWDFYVQVLHERFEPWLLLAVAVVVCLLIMRQLRRDPRAVWLAGWAGTMIVACSLVATKLPWYVVPALPPLAALAAVAVVKLVSCRAGWIPLAAAAVLAVWRFPLPAWSIVSCVAAIGLAAVAAGWMWRAAPSTSRWQEGCAWVAVAVLLAVDLAVLRLWLGDVKQSPWPAVSQRVQAELPGRPTLTVGTPPFYDASFYLHREDCRRKLSFVSAQEFLSRTNVVGASVLLAPHELADALTARGWKPAFRESNIVVFVRHER